MAYKDAEKKTAAYKAWYEKNKERKQAGDRAWRDANKSRMAANNRAWRKSNPTRDAYKTQRVSAKKRGIEFLLSYEQWLAIWGDNIKDRGCRSGQLVMCRFGDAGPYSVDNVFIALQSTNTRLAVLRRVTPND